MRVRTQDGTANAGQDYTAVDEIVTFASGEILKLVTIPLLNDSVDEDDETINLSVSEPGGGAELGTRTSAVLTISGADETTPSLSIASPASTTTKGQLSGSATIGDSSNATGTLTFSFFGPDDSSCSAGPVFTSSVAVNGNATYTSGGFRPARTGTYRLVVSYSGDANNLAVSGSCADPNAVVTVNPATVLANIATRMRVETGNNVLIGGIIVSGTLPKRMLLRATGPSSGVVGALDDPNLQLFSGADLIAENDNWRDAPNQQEIIDTTIPPSDDRESAILVTLNPGLYTAIVSGVNGQTGVGLVEAYDLDRSVDTQFANIATRGRVQTGDNAMIGGLIVVGDTAQKVLLRAIGPSLGIAGQLEDPLLQLFNGNGDPIAANNDWKESQQADIEATTIPPANDLESAIVATLPPSSYTAIVRGVDDTTGIALVEAYALE